MIIESKAKPSEEAESADAPPAYEELQARPPPGFRGDQKSRDGPAQSPPLAGPSTPQVPTSPSTSGANHASGSSNKNWFKFGSWRVEKETQKEVKQIIQSLIRDVVKEPSSPAAVSVMQSCLEACQARGLSFESIVSEKFIEGHSPLYWAIVKRPSPSSVTEDDQVQLLDILLSFPLNSTSRSEAYHACLLSSDQVLFHRLRRTPGFHPPSISPADELLLGEAPEDEIIVGNREGDHGEFQVIWNIAQFHKRMRVVGGIGTEVVARGRIWSLAFTVLPCDTTSNGTHMKAGSWVASVSLLAPSPPTHIDAQFSIAEPVTPQTPSPAAPPSPSLSPSPSLPTRPLDPTPPPSQTRKGSLARWSNSSKIIQKPTISLRVKTDMIQMEPIPLRPTRQDLREHVLTEPGYKTLIVPLSSHSNGDSLQFDGCTYLNLDGSLSVVFDARLSKSDAGGDCVIC